MSAHLDAFMQKSPVRFSISTRIVQSFCSKVHVRKRGKSCLCSYHLTLNQSIHASKDTRSFTVYSSEKKKTKQKHLTDKARLCGGQFPYRLEWCLIGWKQGNENKLVLALPHSVEGNTRVRWRQMTQALSNYFSLCSKSLKTGGRGSDLGHQVGFVQLYFVFSCVWPTSLKMCIYM